MTRYFLICALILELFVFASCSRGDDAKTVGDTSTVSEKIERSNYLSGEAFCARYVIGHRQEFSRFVSVPKDYLNPRLGSLSIYTSTPRPFDPSKPSVVIFDGGPGQNSHGRKTDYFQGRVNEVRFDQRGLGCSAPSTFDEYQNNDLYSSEFTARDADEIRKAYGITKWTVFGGSYGTVPSTIYAALFAAHTRASILEGVFNDISFVHDANFKAARLNAALKRLNASEREAFDDLMYREDRHVDDLLFDELQEQLYLEDAEQVSVDFIRNLVSPDGTIREVAVDQFLTEKQIERSRYPTPQNPRDVDFNLNIILFCKDLDYRSKAPVGVWYSSQRGFFAGALKGSGREACERRGLALTESVTYRPANYPTTVPTYYFQGVNDAATLASGAWEHFRVVPKGRVRVFLLAENGGHMPNLRRLKDESEVLATKQLDLVEKAVLGRGIDALDVASLNALTPDRQWSVHLSPNKTPQIQRY